MRERNVDRGACKPMVLVGFWARFFREFGSMERYFASVWACFVAKLAPIVNRTLFIERNVPSEDKAIFAIFSPGTRLGILFRSVDYIAIEDEALIMLLGVRYVFRKSNGIWGAFRKHVDGMRVGAYDRMISIIAVPAWLNQPVRDSTNNAFLSLEHQALTRPELDVDMWGADT